MQWSDVRRPASSRQLRQFAGLFLLVFVALAASRWFGGRQDAVGALLASLGAVVGGAGLAAPALVRPVYTGWMIAAFPIGWTVSRVALGVMFFLVVTPIAWAFRMAGRDALRLRRPASGSYWLPKRQPTDTREYFRLS